MVLSSHGAIICLDGGGSLVELPAWFNSVKSGERPLMRELPEA